MSTHPTDHAFEDATQNVAPPLKPPLRAPVKALLQLGSVARNLLALALPICIIQIYDRVIPNGAYDTLIVLIVILLSALLLETLVRNACNHVRRDAGLRHAHELTVTALERVLNADAGARDAVTTGENVARIKAIEQVQDYYAGQAQTQFVDGGFAMVNLALIWLFSGALVLIPVFLVCVFILVAVILARRIRSLIDERVQAEALRQDFLLLTLEALHLVRASAIESIPVSRYERVQGQLALNTHRSVRSIGLLQSLGIVIAQLIIVSFVSFGALAVIDGRIGLGTLAACTLLAGRVLQPFLRGVAIWAVFQHVTVATRSARAILSLPADRRSQCLPVPVTEGRIELRDVTVGFDPDQPPVLDHLNLVVEPGQTVGIVGANGSGKTTLMRVLVGGLSPQSGEVLIDGTPAEYIDASQIGVLPQKGALLPGTILENISMGRGEAVVPDAVALCEKLGLLDQMKLFPRGLDTAVASGNAANLPGGMRQQILMVRHLVNKPPIIAIDESNALLDRAADAKFLELLRGLSGNHTVLVNSHRPSVLRECDVIYRLKRGALTRVTLDTNAGGKPDTKTRMNTNTDTRSSPDTNSNTDTRRLAS